jgi:aldose 1-epimerase
MAPRVLSLFDGAAQEVVVPEAGAGLASYDLIEADRRTPLFRPCRDLSPSQPFELASNLLLPWSNRISGGGFLFAGKFHPLAPNLPGEPYPIHGNGFSSGRDVEAAAAASVELSLTSSGPGVFRYAARASYALRSGALTMGLTIVNLAAEPLPFGLGFRPWIVRTPETLPRAKAQWIALETSDHPPSGTERVPSRPEWDFGAPRELPSGWINNAFLGRDGRADVVWRDRKLALEIIAVSPLNVCIVYSPSDKADFICFLYLLRARHAPGRRAQCA